MGSEDHLRIYQPRFTAFWHNLVRRGVPRLTMVY